MSNISALYVDDEPELLEVARLFLEATGEITVDTCTSPLLAREKLKTTPYDVIISDYQMPEMDGIAFLKIVRTEQGTIPFILFTGKGREEVVIQAINNGADFYLQKGGDAKAQFAELAHKIRQAVQRKRAETSVHDHERRESDIINFLPDATFAIDSNGIVIAWNRAMERMTGIRTVDILGKGNYEYAIPFYRERRPILIDLVLRNDPDAVARYPFIKRDGKTLFSEITIPHFNDGRGAILWFTASPLYDMNGAMFGAIESIREITESKRTEQALRESEEKFRGMADRLPQIIYETDENGILTYANAIAFEAYGYAPEDLKQKIPAVQMFVPEDRERVQRALTGFLTGSISRSGNEEYTALRKDGSSFPVTIYTAPIVRSGRITGLQGIVVDNSGRRHMDQDLRERERFLTTLVSNLPGFVYRCANDRNWTMMYISEGCQAITGYSPDDFLNNRTLSFNDIIHPDHRERLWQKWQSLLEKHAVFEDEYPIATKSGETRWVWERGRGLFSGDGQLLFLEGFITDVTRQKTMEATLSAKTVELEKSEIRYRNIVESFEDLYYETDAEGIIRYLSPSCHPLTGWAAEELTGKPVMTVYVDESDREGLIASMKETGYVRDYELVLKKRDGTLTPVSLSAHFIRNPDGSRAGIAGSLRDITDRKKAEEEVRKSREQLALAIAGSGAGIWDWNIQTGSLIINERWAEIVGHSMKDLEPVSIRTWTGLCHPDDLKRSDELLQRHFSGEIPEYEFEARMLHANGRWVWVLDRGKVVEWDDGHRPVRMIGTHMDITRIKQMESALRQANAKLNLLNSITRHDISNQLLALKGFLALSKGRLTDPVRMAECIAKEERITATLENQVVFTRYYQDMGVKEPVWQDVREHVKKAAASLPVNEITIRTDCSGLEVYADPLFEKVFYNLIDNALRYGGAGLTTVRISSHETDEGLVLTCEDDGAGIAPGDKAHLFERGFGKNTGLGLFLVREILGITGITIRETGASGKGARFEILVPRGEYRSG